MATFILTAVGTAIAGPVGGAVGGIIGSLIDSYIILPLIFGPQRVEGPRLEDLSIQMVSEGSPLKRIIGPQNPAAGTIIWMTDLIEVEDTTTHGGAFGIGGTEVTTYTYFVHAAVHIADCPLRPIRRIDKIRAGSTLVFDAAVTDPVFEDDDIIEYGPSPYFDSMIVYKGTTTQPVDDLIEETEGAGLVPAFIRSAYVRFENFALADFSNQLPNWTFEIVEDSNTSVGEAILQMAQWWGFEENEIDVSRVSPCFRGGIITGPQQGDRVLGNLLAAYAISVQETSDGLVFFMRGDEIDIEVDALHLATHEPGGEAAYPFKRADCNPLDLPREVTITYLDADFDLQQASKRELRIDADSDTILRMDAPFTFKGTEAKNIVRRAIWAAQMECSNFTLDLPPNYITALASDTVAFTSGGEDYVLRIREIHRGHNWLMRVTGALYAKHIYENVAYFIEPPPGSTGIYEPPESVLVVLDGPAISVSQVESLGLHFAVAAEDPTARWRGAGIFRSTDNINYSSFATVRSETTMGVLTSELFPGPHLIWDRGNTLEVELTHGSLSSATEEDVLDGENWAFVGDELIGYATVEALGDRRYRLSDLLRGLRNTEQSVDTHVPGEAFLKADPSTLTFLPITAMELGQVRYFKAPAVGATVASVDEETITPMGQSMKPFSPVDITMERQSDDDMIISWRRRSRAITDPFSPGPAPFMSGETPEKYEVDIINGGTNGAVLRTIEVSAATSINYTAAQQTADGWVLGLSPIRCKIYQMSEWVGRGNPGEKVSNE